VYTRQVVLYAFAVVGALAVLLLIGLAVAALMRLKSRATPIPTCWSSYRCGRPRLIFTTSRSEAADLTLEGGRRQRLGEVFNWTALAFAVGPYGTF